MADTLPFPLAEPAGGRLASEIIGRGKRWLQVTQFCSKLQKTVIQTPLHGLRRNAEQTSRLDLREALNPHQVKHFALVVGKAFNRFENPQRIGTELGTACLGTGD